MPNLLHAILSEEKNIHWEAVSNKEWEIFAREAIRGGVAPLAYWILSKSEEISALPQSIREVLRAAYIQTWRQNQDLFSELEILAREFARADISVVALKGACFALTIYPDVGMRPMGDLDLLVPAAKINAAVEIAKTLGYENEIPEASSGLRALLNHEVCLQKKSVTLELHTSLIADKTFKYAVPVDWFWCQIEKLNDARFPNLWILSPAAQILYASAHAMLQHGGRLAPLRWFVDIDRLIRFYAQRIDWDTLLSQAKTFAWLSAVDAALMQTQMYFNTPIPDGVRAYLSTHTDQFKELVELLKRAPVTHTQEEYQKMIRLNTQGRIRLALALIFPSPTYMHWRYQFKSAWGLPFYYVLRWLGIFSDGLRTLANLAKNS